jgi:hypothetical protein
MLAFDYGSLSFALGPGADMIEAGTTIRLV